MDEKHEKEMADLEVAERKATVEAIKRDYDHNLKMQEIDRHSMAQETIRRNIEALCNVYRTINSNEIKELVGSKVKSHMEKLQPF